MIRISWSQGGTSVWFVVLLRMSTSKFEVEHIVAAVFFNVRLLAALLAVPQFEKRVRLVHGLLRTTVRAIPLLMDVGTVRRVLLGGSGNFVERVQFHLVF